MHDTSSSANIHDTPAPPDFNTALAVGDISDAIHDDAWAKPKPRTNRRLTVIAAALAVSLFGIGTFTAGAKMARNSPSTSTGGRSGGLGALAGGLPGGFGGGGAGGLPGGFGGGGGRAGRAAAANTNSGATAAGSDALAALLNGTATTGAPAVQGKVTAIDATTITVAKPDGTTAVITIDSKASFARRTTATVKDIAVGDNVAAEGTVDTAGNVAASTITVGDLPDATGDPTQTSDPTPDAGDDLGGLLGG